MVHSSGVQSPAAPIAAAADAASARPAASPIGHLLLVRIAVEGGASRAELARDLAPLFTHELSPADWKRLADTETGKLVAAGLAGEARGRLSATEAGAAAVSRSLAQPAGVRSWSEQRDTWLIAKALGLEGEPQAKLRALLRQDSLRGLIVQKAFGLPLKKNQPVAKLRAQLAMIALERAFGNKIKAGLGQRDALPAKAGRLLAGQLSRTPRDFGTDARLVAELAAEHVGAKDSDTDSLRAGLLKALGTRTLRAAVAAGRPSTAMAAPTGIPTAANDALPKAAPSAPARPGLAEFSARVKRAAGQRAEGWPGNRKAFISKVWAAIRESEPQWGLSEIEFKCMLAEAHRAGHVVLANADLKDKKSLADIESSSVLYKNTVWHFVRVEE
ncbi:MAG: hypothetical protein ACT4N2_09100 [Hyphomicrobium sp.]